MRIGNFTQMHKPWQGILATDSQSVLDGRDSTEQDDGAPMSLDNH
jgi:hypothetical protein